MNIVYPVKFDSAFLQVKDAVGKVVADVKRFSQFKGESEEVGLLIAVKLNEGKKVEKKVELVVKKKRTKKV